jgi:hypothetical protein
MPAAKAGRVPVVFDEPAFSEDIQRTTDTIGPDLYYAPVDTATGTNLDVLEGEPPERVPRT